MVRKGEQGEEMRVNNKGFKMLVGGNAFKHRWAVYFDELLNLEDGEQASIGAIGGDISKPVFGFLNDKGDEL